MHHCLHLAGALGASADPVAPVINGTAEELTTVVRRFGLADEPRGLPLFGLNPGAEYGPAKRWPAERFIAAAVELQRRTNCRWLILGGERDIELAARIATEITRHLSHSPQPLNLAGRTSLREICALLKLCRLLLTNDTGPMHVAAAVGTPVVVPFGSTSPELTGPGLPGDPKHRPLKSDVPCAPCFRRTCPVDFRCMTGIGVDRVVEAVLEVISR